MTALHDRDGSALHITAMDTKLLEQAVAMRGPVIVSRGRVHSLMDRDGYVCLHNDRIAGTIFYHIENDECEIAALDSELEGQGIGTALIEAVVARARERGCVRVWLITSNDNVKAIRFYQKRGFDLVAVHREAITEARRLKPSIPLVGHDGIPVKHEVEFERRLLEH